MKTKKKLSISLTILLIGTASSFLYSMKPYQKPTLESDPDKTIARIWTYPQSPFFTQYTDKTVDLFDKTNGQKINRSPIKPDSNKTILAHWIDQNQLYILYIDKTVDLFAKTAGQKINRSLIKPDSSKTVARPWTYPQNPLFILYTDRTVDLFDKTAGQKINRNPIKPDSSKTIATTWTYQNQLFIQYTDRTVDLFDKIAGQKINRSPIKPDSSKTIVAHWTDQNQLFIQYIDKTVDLFDKITGQKINRSLIKPDSSKTIATTWTYQNQLYIRYKDKTGDLLSLDTGKQIQSFLTWIRRQYRIVQYTDNKTVDLFDKITGQKINGSPIKPDSSKTTASTWTYQNELFILYTDKTVDLFDKITGQKIKHIPIKPDSSKTIASIWTDQNQLFILYTDKTVDLFAKTTGQKINGSPIKSDSSKTVARPWTYQNQLYIQYQNKTGDLLSLDTEKQVKSFLTLIGRQYLIAQYTDNKTVDLFAKTTGQKINRSPINADSSKTIATTWTYQNELFILYTDKTVDLFDKITGQKINRHLIKPDSSKTIASTWANQNQLLILYTDKTVDLFDINNEQKINRHPINADSSKTVARPWAYQNQLFILYIDKTGDLFSLDTGKQIKSFLTWIGRQYLIVQYTDNKTVDLFDINNGQKINRHPINADSSKTVARPWAYQNQLFILYIDKTGDLFSLDTGKQIKSFLTWIGRQYLIVQYTDNKTVDFFDINNGQKIINRHPLNAAPSKTIARLWTDQKQCYILYTDKTVDLFDKITGQKINLNPIKLGSSKAIITLWTDQKQCYVLYTDKTVDLFDKITGQKINHNPIKPDSSKTIASTWTYQNQLFIQYQNKTGDLLSLDTGKQIKSFLTWIGRQYLIVQYTDNKTVDLFDINNGQKINRHPLNAAPSKTIARLRTNQKQCYILYTDKTGDLFDKTTGQKINRHLIKPDSSKTIASTWTYQNQLYIRYKDKTGDLFSLDAGKQIKSFLTWIEQQYLTVQYTDNKTVDLFAKTTGQKINRSPINADSSKTIATTWTYQNQLYIRYKDKTGDLFDKTTGQKINRSPINADSSKTITSTWTYQNQLYIRYKDKTGDLFSLDAGKQIKSFLTWIGRQYRIVKYTDNKTVDLFDKTTGQKINRSPINADSSKTIASTWATRQNQFYIQYTDNTVDLFAKTTGQKINGSPINADSSKTIATTWTYQNQLYIRYKDKTGDLLSLDTGKQIKSFLTWIEQQYRIVKYTDNKTVDLFDKTTGQKINRSPINADSSKTIASTWATRQNQFYIQYTDNTVDLFAKTTGQKINGSPINADSSKTIATTWTYQNQLYIRYKDKTGDLLSLDTGKQIKSFLTWIERQYLTVQYTDNKTVDLFAKTTRQKINRSPINADSSKTITSTWTCQNQLYIRYKDKTVDLFDINNEQKINRSPINADSSKTIATTWTYQNQLYIWYKDKTGELFSLDTGKQIKSFLTWIRRQYLIVQYTDNKIVDLFDRTTGQKINRNPSKADSSKTIATIWTTRQNQLYILYKDKTVDLFDINNGQKINHNSIKPDSSKTITSTWTYQNQLYIWYKDKTGELFSLDTGKQIKSFLTWIGRQYQIVQYTDNKTVDLFDKTTGQKINHNSIKTELSKTISNAKIFAANNNILCIEYEDKTLYLFNISKEKQINLGTIQYESMISTDIMAPCKDILLIEYHNRTTNTRMFGFFNLENGYKINSIAVQNKQHLKLKIENNIIFYIKYRDKTYDMFNIKTGDRMKSYDLKSKNRLLSINHDNEITLFNAKSGDKITQSIKLDKNKKIDAHDIHIMNKLLFVKYWDNSIDLFHMQLNKKLNPSKNIRSFRLSEDGNSISLIYTDDTMDLVDMNSAEAMSSKPIRLKKNKTVSECSLHEDKEDPNKKYFQVCYKKNKRERHYQHNFFEIPSGQPIRKQEIKKIIALDPKRTET